MKTPIHILALISIAMLLAGCHATTKVVQSNSRTVTIQYNSAITGYEKAAALAEKEAEKYNKIPVARENVDKKLEGPFGAVNVLVFDLVEEETE